ncbi:hypothetical protein E2C01_029355 [Portunus trituberculatus]|uniref:Uncharacterized protein n=1 Tax=Portunus trituberculatus TaxID=210409 RepID=A0A5B7ERN4_PORTR|nr:hypothetical protein [Portunus trituberculatus]
MDKVGMSPGVWIFPEKETYVQAKKTRKLHNSHNVDYEANRRSEANERNERLLPVKSIGHCVVVVFTSLIRALGTLYPGSPGGAPRPPSTTVL